CSRRSSASYRHDREQLPAGAVHHGAAVERLAGTQPFALRRRQAHHAPLHLAAVLRARDDFLAGIAAFLEVDAAEGLEVHHLRHELVLRRRGDQRPPGLDLLQVPGFLVSSTPEDGRIWARRCDGLEAQDALFAHGYARDLVLPFNPSKILLRVPDAELRPGVTFVRD